MTAILLPEGKQSFTDANGLPLVGGRVETYQSGTAVPLPTWADAAQTQPNTNPIILDGRGEASIYWSGVYKVILKDALDNVIWTVDPVTDPISGSGILTGGAGVVGFNWATPYPANTVGWGIQVVRNIRQFGAFVGNGVADDTGVWQAAAAAGPGIIDARGVTSKVLGQIDIQNNQTWLLTGSRIVAAGTNLTLFNAVAKTNFHLVGPFRITGDLTVDPGTGVNSKGIYIEDCAQWSVYRPDLFNIQGFGIQMRPGASTRSRGDGGVVIAPRFSQCVWGWDDTAGTGAEYCTVLNLHATGCFQYGASTAAGNIIINGGHIVDNVRNGLQVVNGANHAHGIISDVNCNHNSVFNLVCTQLANGQDFANCHFYGIAAGTAQGAIFLDRCKGIHINGGHLDCAIYNYKDGTSGQNLIENMYCPNGYGINRLAGSNDGHDELIIRNCFGPGQYAMAIAGGIISTGAPINQMATRYTQLQRVAGSTVALTSGVATTLQWPTSNINGAMTGDPFGEYAAGEFTIQETGFYSFEGAQVFGAGTSIAPATSFLELQVNSGGGYQPYEIYTVGPGFGGGVTLSVLHKSKLYLNAGYKLRLQATITGVGALTHGKASYANWISLVREQ